jgi:hypothetical protein
MSESPDQAATRRRWISLAELVAVAGVIIGALTLWNSWSERRTAEVERTAAQREAGKRSRFTLKGTVAEGGESIKLGHDDEHALDDVQVTFPTALGVAAQDAVTQTINRDRFAGPILKLTDGGADDRAGRLPVLVRYSYADADGRHRDSGIFDVIWETHGRRLLGRELNLTDFRMHQRGGTPAQLDALWAREKPTN